VLYNYDTICFALQCIQKIHKKLGDKSIKKHSKRACALLLAAMVAFAPATALAEGLNSQSIAPSSDYMDTNNHYAGGGSNGNWGTANSAAAPRTPTPSWPCAQRVMAGGAVASAFIAPPAAKFFAVGAFITPCVCRP